jgi:hypothetical protein
MHFNEVGIARRHAVGVNECFRRGSNGGCREKRQDKSQFDLHY